MKKNNIPVTRIHSYNVSVAVDVGINAAILFYNICYWVEENAANNRNFINGKYWTYNTTEAFSELFPEMTYNQIDYALRALKKKGYIEWDYLSEDGRDRTKYYTICDFEKWIGIQNCNLEHSKMELGIKSDDIYINNNIDTISDNKQEADDKQSDNSHNIYAFSKEKEENIYASFSEKTEECVPQKESRYIPDDYTEEQLIEHVYPVIDNYIEKRYSEDYDDGTVNTVIDIIVEFYREYEKRLHVKHRILSDRAYKNIVDRYFAPPDIMNDGDCNNLDAYLALIEKYFEVQYNKHGNYNGKITLSISHFMSDEIRSNLFYQTCY